jgi:hypothetical protein
MSKLEQVVESVENYNKFVLDQVKRARTDQKFGRDLLGRWNDTKAKIPVTRTPTGLPLPRLALPEIDEPGEIARFIFGEGLPGEFPYLNATYREMYLEPVRETESFEKNGNKTGKKITQPEEPTRLFSGLMLAEDTNERFHYLTRHQRTHRLSTAFDGPTLYGLDSDADGVFGKIGEGGVAIDTVEDMVRLYDGFDLGSPNFSASMTISGPAPMIMAMYIAAAKRRFGPKVVPKLRGTVQADIFKEVQAQNETIFPIEPSLTIPHRYGRVHYRRNAALVSNLDQRLSHRRGRLDAGATGCLHALERFCVRGNVRRAWNPGRSIRAAPFVLSRLRTRRGVHRALARVAPHLGDRNARRVSAQVRERSCSNCTRKPADAR